MLFQDDYFRKAQYAKDKGLAQAQKLKTLHFIF